MSTDYTESSSARKLQYSKAHFYWVHYPLTCSNLLPKCNAYGDFWFDKTVILTPLAKIWSHKLSHVEWLAYVGLMWVLRDSLMLVSCGCSGTSLSWSHVGALFVIDQSLSPVGVSLLCAKQAMFLIILQKCLKLSVVWLKG